MAATAAAAAASASRRRSRPPGGDARGRGAARPEGAAPGEGAAAGEPRQAGARAGAKRCGPPAPARPPSRPGRPGSERSTPRDVRMRAADVRPGARKARIIIIPILKARRYEHLGLDRSSRRAAVVHAVRCRFPGGWSKHSRLYQTVREHADPQEGISCNLFQVVFLEPISWHEACL
ncbi:translation initiation factor IF-2-like [Zalophus californianus]|uniref:Translation initiation factor IF-2-like n=1 Tax=Zalophus californianus TaxID=9704 RepID=A0A6J2EVY8_ZALCA|nr:translation initiation factor IF-2-like [Zalophus californianus]